MRRCGSASESGIPAGATPTAPDKTDRIAKSDPAAAGGDGLAKGSFITALNSKADGLLPR